MEPCAVCRRGAASFVVLGTTDSFKLWKIQGNLGLLGAEDFYGGWAIDQLSCNIHYAILIWSGVQNPDARARAKKGFAMRKNYDPNSLPGQGAISTMSSQPGSAEAMDLTGNKESNRICAQSIPTLLVEPNTLLREGLKRILAETHYHLAASASTLEEVFQTWSVAADPFLLIVDAANDHEAKCVQVAQLKAELPAARFVMLVDQYDLKRILSAFQAGADAYLIKSVSCEVLVKTLDLVMLGEAVFPSAVLSLLRDRSPEAEGVGDEHQDNEQDSLPRGLSVRETVILRCLMEGDSNKLIARKFDITEATVKVHVKAILRKIRAKNRTQAAIWAASHLPSNGRPMTR